MAPNLAGDPALAHLPPEQTGFVFDRGAATGMKCNVQTTGEEPGQMRAWSQPASHSASFRLPPLLAFDMIFLSF